MKILNSYKMKTGERHMKVGERGLIAIGGHVTFTKVNLQMKKIIFSTLFFFLLVPSALSMGVLQKDFEKSIKAGETAEFNVLFWNTENFGYPVTLFPLDPPEGTFVLILPERFYLNPQNSYEKFEYVARGNEYVKAFPVKILIKTFEGVTGKKEAKIKVLAGEAKNSTLSIFQERILVFSINTEGSFPKTFEKTEKNPFQGFAVKIPFHITKGVEGIIRAAKENYSLILHIFLAIIILLLSIKIYKW